LKIFVPERKLSMLFCRVNFSPTFRTETFFVLYIHNQIPSYKLEVICVGFVLEGFSLFFLQLVKSKNIIDNYITMLDKTTSYISFSIATHQLSKQNVHTGLCRPYERLVIISDCYFYYNHFATPP